MQQTGLLTNRSQRRKRGAAIVITLTAASLMAVLAIGMLGHAPAMRHAAIATVDKDAGAGLAETAVQLALAQLRSGTEALRPDGSPAPWTSQPGLIRIAAPDGSTEALVKLYSDAAMTERRKEPGSLAPPRRWDAAIGRFVDLNTPVPTAGGGDLHFPVADPRAALPGPSETGVEGFRVDTARAAAGTSVGESAPALPMPVQWIYQLEDGTLGTLDESGGFVAAGGGRPGPDNRITGRFAFWTDDETCKVNTATAGEAAFWDTPRADTAQERALARHQPLRHEFHRQPGHPASVSLSSVLAPGQRFHPLGFEPESVRRGSAAEALTHGDFLTILQTARQAAGHAWQGTSAGGHAVPSLFGRSAEPDMDASPDRPVEPTDIVFAAAEGGTRRPLAAWFHGRDDRLRRLARSGFFLTTSSAAPEATIHDTPRLALWPVHSNAPLQHGASKPLVVRSSDYDAAVAAASRVGPRIYCVRRARPGDGAFDLETTAGGANRALFDHLERLTSRPVPGFFDPGRGLTTFADKYGSGPGSDREGILLGMLDYIRSANFSDGHLPADTQFPVLCPGNAHEGFGQVSPLTTADPASGLRGQGRILTISEIAFAVICRAEVAPDGRLRGQPTAANRPRLTRPGMRELEAAILLEAFVPSQGWADYRPYVSVALEANAGQPSLPAMMLNGQALVPLQSRPQASSPADPPAAWLGWGGYAGIRCLGQRVIQFRPVVAEPAADGAPAPLVFSGSGSPDNTSPRLRLAVFDDPGGAAAGPSGRGDLVQTIPFDLPPIDGTASGLTLPPLPPDGVARPFSERLSASLRLGSPIISAADVVQSLVPRHGDFRLAAGRSRLPDNFFRPHPHWGVRPQAHALREPGLPATEAAAVAGTGYFPDLAMAPGTLPDWIAGIDDPGPAATGDFDNGVGQAPDGPYCHRPDDGHLQPAAAGGDPYFTVRPADRELPTVSAAAFSALRLMPSAAMFGSLPARLGSGRPWQTLLFRPQPDHPGASQLPDHLLLDAFWQPIVEPAPLSHRLETEGRVNLNHELVPFPWIERRTALHAVLKGETLMSIPDAASATYKTGGRAQDRFRHHLDVAATLQLWDEAKHRLRRPFLTASEICTLPLVPEGFDGELSPAGIAAWWQRHRLTGDNSRERPYARLLPHFTTRSNVYRVHFIAEVIRGSGGGTFDPERDAVVASKRGSCRIRRQLDPDDPRLPDYATQASAPPLRLFHRWSIGDWREVR